MRGGLTTAAAAGFLGGIDATVTAMRSSYESAVRDARVTGTIDGAVRRYIERKAGPARLVASDLAAALFKWLQRAGISPLVAAALAQDRAFALAFERIFDAANHPSWTPARYVAAVKKLLERFTTLPGGAVGSALLAFIETTLVKPFFETSRLDFLRESTMREVVPYLMQVTRNDDAVRPNHFALHGFVARVTSSVWKEILAPLGWQCRCGVIEVPWHIADARKWRGEFPLGTAKLDEFRQLGGADAGFPRELFVTGAETAIS